ncbi:SAM-dependent methyltransferase [Ignavibacterium album JCM 16511]|uniref:SAM-dependent methyltransferase n=1 Tax=Ignavibacterium album (strain DSM 19864 / JCM 16511 / NBRC 101810 / Mat9-16) TaxID=945713 RepID=I0AHU5_IGNAJ|nr:class I SAM-dependent methyltransferase [Ignavibacterium album]AFH48552.1 SAM-dependent methyltransferase [Ignavibacterium album JCM 16511]
MEITNSIPVWLDKDHPNFLRWERARNISLERGKFVKQVLEQNFEPINLSVLDLGSGEGGTSKILSEKNFVISLDINFIRLKRQKENFNLGKLLQADAIQLPFSDSTFDLIIIQDVIEHIENLNQLHSELLRVLKEDGLIYLSTPNRFSIINFLSDPHWGNPFISILSRNIIKNIFIRFFRKKERSRNDIPQLLSLKTIRKLFSKDFEIKLMTDFSVDELFKENKGIVWSDFHLKLINIIKSTKADRIVKRISNNHFGFVNKYLTPTFYFIMKKNSQ